MHPTQFGAEWSRTAEGQYAEEREVRNLVRHFERQGENRDNKAARERLHAELADYLKKLQRGPLPASMGAA